MKEQQSTYDALCIDTCVYQAHGFAFEKGLLKQLEQFALIQISLVVPEIVHHELERHIAEQVHTARSKVQRALRIASKALSVSEQDLNTAEQLLLGEGDQKLCSDRLTSFYKRTKAELVPASEAAMARLVQMYFEGQPPFETSGSKKAEFPDAIALLSLEEWAQSSRRRVLVVSTDGGWRSFCRKSRFLDSVPALADALAHFQPHNYAAVLIAELRTLLASGRAGGIVDDIRDAMASSVDRAVVEAEASSTYILDERYVGANYLGHEFHRELGGEPEVHLIRVTTDGIVIQLGAAISCEVTAEYSVYLSDWEKHPIGRRKVSAAKDFDADIVISLSGDLSRGLSGAHVERIDVEGYLDPVKFTDIDPDPDYDEWDREKYT
jgi:hypothetical protein